MNIGSRTQVGDPRRRLARFALIAALLTYLAISSTNGPFLSAQESTLRGEVALPDTPAGKQFEAWLAAFNSSDPARYKQFIANDFPAHLPDVDRDMRLRDQTGGFELRKIEEASASHISGLLQERDSDQFVRFTTDVEAAEPHPIVGLLLRAIPRPAEFPIARLTKSKAIAAAKARIQDSAAARKFAGAVLIAKNGNVVFSGAYGLADREKKIPNTLDTRFRIGSMNKMFTAVAVMQLVEAGKIKLTEPLGTYVTDYPNQDVATKVTIHELLTHTGGTGDFFGPEFIAHRKDLRTLDDYVALFGKRGLAFEPGTRWEYSNYGMVLLGVVIERVSHQSYYDYVQEHIFEPAGMTLTGSFPEDQNVPGRSIGYMKLSGTDTWLPNTDTLPYRGTSAGGGYSTVGDLSRFASALLSHKLLSAGSTDLLITGKVDAPGGRYAYGFVDARDKDGNGWVGHNGGAPGMNGDLRIYRRSGYVVAVLANMDPPAAEHISNFLDNRLPL